LLSALKFGYSARSGGMQQSNWVPDEVLLDRPNVARMWDFFLGGGHNFAIDREAAEQAIKLYPDLPMVAQVTRGFLGRAVRYLLSQGVDQFLDVGAGIPTANSVHEIAQRVVPTARVAYIDIDPVAVAHSQAILQRVENTVAIRADARQPEEIISHPEVRRVLDFSRPIGVLAIAMLHFVPEDEEALRIVRVLRDGVVPGSHIAMTHATADAVERARADQGEQLYQRTSAQLHFRTHDQVLGLLEGLELVDPGVVFIPRWRPETDHDLMLDQAERSANYAGIGRKP
jgi:S-adenosyl methyltransferase